MRSELHEVRCQIPGCRKKIGNMIASEAEKGWMCGGCVKKYKHNRNQFMGDYVFKAIQPDNTLILPNHMILNELGVEPPKPNPDEGIYWRDADAAEQIFKDAQKAPRLYSFNGKPIIPVKDRDGVVKLS